MNTIQEVSESTLKFEALFSGAGNGTFFSYGDLYEKTKILMDNKGKTYMRSALHRLKLPYETVSGQGIRLLSKENATRIVVRDVMRIDRSVKKAEKTTKHVNNRVFDELPKEQQEQVRFLGSLFGAIRAYSQSARAIFKPQAMKIGDKI